MTCLTEMRQERMKKGKIKRKEAGDVRLIAIT